MSKIIVLFEVTPTKDGMKRYLELAAQLKPMLAGFEGFISAERFQSITDEGKLLSMNLWENEEAVTKWRNVIDHRMCQQEGKDKLFESYKITVTKSLREYTKTNRNEAPLGSNATLFK